MLQFMDGFNHYDPGVLAELSDKWPSTTGSNFSKVTGPDGVGNAVSLNHYLSYPGVPITGGVTEVVFGLDFKIVSIIGHASQYGIVLFNSTQYNNTIAPRIGISTDKKLTVRRGSTNLATGTTVLLNDTWYNLQGKLLFGNSGNIELKLNGNEEIASQSADTYQSGTTTLDSFHLGTVFNTVTHCANVWLFDTTGGVNDDFPSGVGVVKQVLPDGDEGTNQWAATGAGSTHADRVDEAAADGDTTYLASSTTNDKELFTYESLSGNIDSVLAAQVVSVAKKDDSGAQSFRALLKHSSSTDNGATKTLTESYATYTEPYDENPSTSAAFTVAEANAISAGAEVTG